MSFGRNWKSRAYARTYWRAEERRLKFRRFTGATYRPQTNLPQVSQPSGAQTGRDTLRAPSSNSSAAIAFIAALIIFFASAAGAMDRFAAISQIETGDNDLAVGRDGEVSRFQIDPLVCAEFGFNQGSLTNRVIALEAARTVMASRCAAFESRFHRSPTDLEFYPLWNAPAFILQPERRQLAPRRWARICERAARFVNLVTRRDDR